MATFNHPVRSISDPPEQVLILCAAEGGAVMLKRFFQALPENLPLAYVLLMPMAQEFYEAFSRRLAATVETLQSSHLAAIDRLESGQCLVLTTVAKSSVQVVQSLAGACHRPGIIVFSGIGDNASVCQHVSRQGGLVMAQTGESAVAAEMPDSARATNTVEFSGTPEMLAVELFRRVQQSSYTTN
ncbi:MAG: chemotaxis protein CheB [Gammaproteobacteria bacterium]